MSIASFLLKAGLSRVVLTGSLQVITANGENLVFGDGTAPHVVVRLTDTRALWALLFDPDLQDGRVVHRQAADRRTRHHL